jgi:hypothetical protein
MQALPEGIEGYVDQITVILDSSNTDDCRMTSEHLDRLRQSEYVMRGEYSDCKVEVPQPSFTRQDVSSRQDVD